MADESLDSPASSPSEPVITRPSRSGLNPHWLVWVFILLMISQSVYKWMTQQPRWVGEQKVAQLVVDINTADPITLAGLPGLGPQIAQRVINHRQAHGPFATPDDLVQVKGIGPGKMVLLRPYIIAGPQVALPPDPSPLMRWQREGSPPAIVEESEPLPDAVTTQP